VAACSSAARVTPCSLNANSGCRVAAFKPDAPVRTAITIGAGEQGRWLAYFGDQRANAYAVDALTGALVWKRSVDSFPGATITGAPTLADGTLYVATSSAEEVLGANPKYECCKFRGSLSALNATTGEVRWKSYTIPEEAKPVRKNAQGVQLWGPSGAGVWSSAVDPKRAVFHHHRRRVLGSAGSTSDSFMAFDIKTGKLLWTRQVTSGDAYVACGLPGRYA
jgi:polyvinyl alcohol dehydrogenase (cytochrome)